MYVGKGVFFIVHDGFAVTSEERAQPGSAGWHMQFSRRTNWNTEHSELASAHRARVEAGLPIADLTASNPTRCGFSYPADVLKPLNSP